MICILCNYELDKFDWYAHNTDVIDFVKITCYKRFDEYVKWKSYENNNSNTESPKLETEE